MLPPITPFSSLINWITFLIACSPLWECWLPLNRSLILIDVHNVVVCVKPAIKQYWPLRIGIHALWTLCVGCIVIEPGYVLVTVWFNIYPHCLLFSSRLNSTIVTRPYTY